jgi:hypothetical protein
MYCFLDQLIISHSVPDLVCSLPEKCEYADFSLQGQVILGYGAIKSISI